MPPEALTAPDAAPARPAGRRRASCVLFAVALVLLAARAAVFSLQSRLPAGVIGYADAPTTLYVAGTSPLPLLLWAGAALLAAAGAVLLRRGRRRR